MSPLPPIEPRVPKGVYGRLGKRALDVACSIAALVCLSPVLLVTAFLVRTKLGSPVIFRQVRPGLVDPETGQEALFELYKFRTMTDARDAEGNLLPDGERLTLFGKALRSTSLDELPELVNILKGDMSVVGPRPQLVRDMVFMTPEQRMRHTVRPGLTGLAQVRGRNALSWEGKLAADLEYVDSVTLLGDARIVLRTVAKVFGREGISAEGMDTAEDYGDCLLREGKITAEEYAARQEAARKMMP